MKQPWQAKMLLASFLLEKNSGGSEAGFFLRSFIHPFIHSFHGKLSRHRRVVKFLSLFHEMRYAFVLLDFSVELYLRTLKRRLELNYYLYLIRNVSFFSSLHFFFIFLFFMKFLSNHWKINPRSKFGNWKKKQGTCKKNEISYWKFEISFSLKSSIDKNDVT